jgi:hypothetical protein
VNQSIGFDEMLAALRDFSDRAAGRNVAAEIRVIVQQEPRTIMAVAGRLSRPSFVEAPAEVLPSLGLPPDEHAFFTVGDGLFLLSRRDIKFGELSDDYLSYGLGSLRVRVDMSETTEGDCDWHAVLQEWIPLDELREAQE